MSCEPAYTYRPTFTPSNVKCVAPGFAEHRSRLTENQAFFRSKDQGPSTNNIELEITGGHLNVYFDNVLVEQYTAFVGAGGIASLRSAVAGSKYIEMPVFGYDIFDFRSTEDDVTIGLTAFARTHMKGGSGAPTDATGLAGIRTGPDRSIVIITTTEAADGSPVTPPYDHHVRQWNGYAWVSYSNLVPGACPYEGTS